MDYRELAHREAERRAIGRRTFLGAGAAGLLLPTLAGCENDGPLTPPLNTDPTVVIVGAGIAGLNCAHQLNKLGVRADIYEAQQRAGGRMWSIRDTIHEGMHGELGGELIDTGHPTIHDLCAEFNIELLDYDNDPAKLSLYGYIGGKVLSDEEILTGFAPIAAKIDESWATMYDPDLFVTYKDANGGAYLDALSIRAWFDQMGLPDSDMRKMIEVCYNIEFGLETDVSNCLNLIALISTDTTKFDVFGSSDERFHVKNGNDSIPTAIADTLADQILYGNVLVAIRELSDGRYVLSFDQDGYVYDVVADYAVIAIPFTMLRNVDIQLDLPKTKRIAIEEMQLGWNTKLICGFKSRPWRKPEYDSNGLVYTDLPFQYTLETSRLQSPDDDRGILTNYTGGYASLKAGGGTKEERMAEFLGQFDEVFPGVKAAGNGKVERMFWPDFPWTRGAYSSYTVGQYTRFATVESEPYNNVIFCGEHTSFDFQGWMEGGALSGARAAMEVALGLGLTESDQAALLAAPEDHPSPQVRIMRRALLEKLHGSYLRATKRQRGGGRGRHGRYRRP